MSREDERSTVRFLAMTALWFILPHPAREVIWNNRRGWLCRKCHRRTGFYADGGRVHKFWWTR